MALRASDLPEHMKHQLTEGIREHMGAENYRRLADAVGEDALIDAMLQGASEGSPARTSSPSGADALANAAALVVVVIMAIACGVDCYCGKPILGQHWLAGVLGVVWGAWMGIVYYGGIVWLIRRVHYGIGIAVALAVLCGAAYVLWKVIAFAAGGTGSWFHWLFGHF